jgi:hypothetical protein
MAWWQKEAGEMLTEIRSVQQQLTETLATLQEFESRLNAVAGRPEGCNRQINSRRDWGE